LPETSDVDYPLCVELPEIPNVGDQLNILEVTDDGDQLSIHSANK